MGLAVLPYFHAKQCWNTNVIHWSKKENMEIYHQIYRKSSDDVELLQNQEVCFHFDVGVKLQTVSYSEISSPGIGVSGLMIR